MELEDTACEHCGAMAGACSDYPHCAGGPTEAERLRGALNRLGEKNAELEAANRDFALNEAKMRTGWWIQNYQELHAKVAARDAVIRKIVETAQEHPAKANFVAVHRQIIGEARELLGSTPSGRAES